jgi:hypothetical protein
MEDEGNPIPPTIWIDREGLLNWSNILFMLTMGEMGVYVSILTLKLV